MEIIMRTFWFSKTDYGVNRDAGKMSSAKERQKAHEEEILKELKDAGYTLDTDGACEATLSEWASREGYRVEPYHERAGMYFLINLEKEYVSLIAVGMKMLWGNRKKLGKNQAFLYEKWLHKEKYKIFSKKLVKKYTFVVLYIHNKSRLKKNTLLGVWLAHFLFI